MSFFEVFQPGLRHLREERDRRRSMVVRPTHGGGAPLGIDLDAGTARIVLPAPAAPPAPAPAVVEGDALEPTEPERPPG